MNGKIVRIQLNPEKRNTKNEITKEPTISLAIELPVDDPNNSDALEELQQYIHNETLIISIERKQLIITDIQTENEDAGPIDKDAPIFSGKNIPIPVDEAQEKA